ncbi:hypothetical protein CROQUDRAFT_99545 [Cronartium quercuum f. sp. fusiforme G11]|uniref:Secreted protein n=1 Tax=Cronartium quercuum f. sp. fusiforme G11 TaxID=708437 RepID=A0A9P6T7V2_9BASI|nr:hypothetical protein CROQUDRAFT_99545 [Cronartium quercuum f. sp. fusiforme G11]
MKSFVQVALLLLVVIFLSSQGVESSKTPSHIKRMNISIYTGNLTTETSVFELACSANGIALPNTVKPTCSDQKKVICSGEKPGKPRSGKLACEGSLTIPTVQNCMQGVKQGPTFCSAHPISPIYVIACEKNGIALARQPVVSCPRNNGKNGTPSCQVPGGTTSESFPGIMKCSNGGTPKISVPSGTNCSKPVCKAIAPSTIIASVTRTSTQATTVFKTSCTANGTALTENPTMTCSLPQGKTGSTVAECLIPAEGVTNFASNVQCSNGGTLKVTGPNACPAGQNLLCKVNLRF